MEAKVVCPGFLKGGIGPQPDMLIGKVYSSGSKQRFQL